MKYSVIIPFRNRHEHLTILRQRLAKVFSTLSVDKAERVDYEIIVVEQNDSNKFRRANLLNEGARAATGDILVFHDVDYYPSGERVIRGFNYDFTQSAPVMLPFQYWDGESDCFLPVQRVKFVYNDLTPRPILDVPGGYRHFENGVDENFFGGVVTFKRDAFWKINGFSTRYVGWGFEDADLRERVYHYGLSVKRSQWNLFYALYHPDSGPKSDDPDFRNNIALATNWHLHLDDGLMNKWAPSVEEVPTQWVRWLKVTQFEAPNPVTTIHTSNLYFD